MDQAHNPYASPQAETSGYRPEDVALRVDLPPYRSARAKTTFLVAVTAVVLVLEFLVIGSLLLQIKMLYEASSGTVISDASWAANDSRQQTLAWVSIVATIFALIPLLMWVYHTHRNLPALGAKRLEFTPGWSVGWFFVPILNLIKPYQAIMEIWKQSDPAQVAGSQSQRLPKPGTIVTWWWVMRIVGAFAGNFSNALASDDPTVENYLLISWTAIALMIALDIPMFVCQILMALQVQKFQDERHRLLTSPPLPITSSVNPFAGLT